MRVFVAMLMACLLGTPSYAQEKDYKSRNFFLPGANEVWKIGMKLLPKCAAE